MNDRERPVLRICVTCAQGEAVAAEAARPGRLLFDALKQQPGLTELVDLKPITCLAACDRACTATISQPGKWTYILGRLSRDCAEDLLTYAASYASSATGVVLPSKRPTSLRQAILGRVPGRGHQPPDPALD